MSALEIARTMVAEAEALLARHKGLLAAMTSTFNMPPEEGGSFQDDRAGWVVGRLMAEPELGFTNPIHPAAIVGNLGGESRLTAIQEVHPIAGRGGFGWEQATGSRRIAFELFASSHHLRTTDDEANYEFLVEELTNTEHRALDRLKLTTTLEAATYTFEVAFERPSSTSDINSRVRYAQRALDAYQAPVAAELPTPIAPAIPVAQPDPPVVVVPAAPIAVVPDVPPVLPAPVPPLAPAPVATIPVFPVGAMAETAAARSPWWTLPSLGVLVIMLFAGVLAEAAYVKDDTLLTQMTPYLTAGFVMTLGYFFGSSAGKAKQDDTAQITALKVP
jgi:Phage tail lysozyme